VFLSSFMELESFQLLKRITITGTFGQNVVPQSFGPGMIAAFFRYCRQIAPGHMAIDSLIEAAKLVGTL
jgi:hypothetical protein